MNKQGPKGIEWCDFTWNPVAGCQHACAWQMPDGSVAECYAKTVAEGLARAAYPDGFSAHYWHEKRIGEPLKVKQPARIFLDSMADLFGHWVPEREIVLVLDVVRQASWHTFLSLTKNAPRLRKFAHLFPPNLYVGVSMPPTFMWGRQLSDHQQYQMLGTALDVLSDISNQYWVGTWLSAEPLSFDVAGMLRTFMPLDWIVIGAASNGRTKYQPDPAHVQALLDVADAADVPVFMKGNLVWPQDWRQEYP